MVPMNLMKKKIKLNIMMGFFFNKTANVYVQKNF